MEKSKAVDAVIEVLTTVQKLSGRAEARITGSTCPIGDLDEFDSLSGVEASALLSDQLGFDLPGVNAFVNEQGTNALTVDQIAEAVCKASSEAKG